MKPVLKPGETLHWQADDAVLSSLQAAFQLGNVADGVLPSAFLVGLLVASVAFSELTRRYNAFRMIGVASRKPCVHIPAMRPSCASP